MAFDPETDPGWGMAPTANPYASGFAQGSGYVDDPGTSFDQSGGGIFGTGVSATQLSQALGQLQKGLQQPSDGGSGTQQHGAAPVGQAQSNTGQGSPAGINALIQMLMQRANAYFPGQPNRQPVALARPSGGGLLGI